MNDFEKKALTFYTMIVNAYRDPEDMETVGEKLTIDKGQSFNEDITALLVAMFLVLENFIPDETKDMDLIGFTHFLNRIAIQHCFGDSANKKEQQR